jgi:hypothetical protein
MPSMGTQGWTESLCSLCSVLSNAFEVVPHSMFLRTLINLELL